MHSEGPSIAISHSPEQTEKLPAACGHSALAAVNVSKWRSGKWRLLGGGGFPYFVAREVLMMLEWRQLLMSMLDMMSTGQ